MSSQEVVYINQKTSFFPKEVLFIEADINYTKFTFCDGRCLVTTVTMKEVEKLLLAYNFIRIHKSYLVNRSYIISVKVDKKETSICLSDNLELSVSRRKKAFVRKNLK